MNTERKEIIIRPADENNPNAAPFYREERKLVMARWNYKDLIQRFEEMMKWDTNNHTYKVEGTYSMDDNILFFDLNTAQIIK